MQLERLLTESRKERDGCLDLIYWLLLEMRHWSEYQPEMLPERWASPGLRSKELLERFVSKNGYVEVAAEKTRYLRRDVDGRPLFYVTGRHPKHDTVLRTLNLVERGPPQEETPYCDECRGPKGVAWQIDTWSVSIFDSSDRADFVKNSAFSVK